MADGALRFEVPPTPRSHPASRAWHRLQPRASTPTGVDRLKENRKSSVYRLHGAGPEGSAIVAKLCRREITALEHSVYEECLAHVSARSLRCFGVVDAQEPGFAWLFVEDAGDTAYSREHAEHRRLASRFLAALHVARPVPASRLPERGPAHYLSRLRQARDSIRERLSGPGAVSPDRDLLQAVLDQCDSLEREWGRMEDFCASLPRSLVHGDVSELNARVRSDRDGQQLLLFDWEKAGWGSPVADLAHIDAETYWSVAREHWTNVSLADVDRMTAFALILRPLVHGWASKPPRKLLRHHRRMHRAMTRVGWECPQR
jgi:Ser/Thr protein kinase RdoA (MazF antagonist)